MRTNTAERTCEVQTTGDIRGAQIADSAAMFDILYNRLYTNKELAVVRELITNAWDSHCRAHNTATPIDVHLPTSLEPWFTVRDYGVGLSPEAVETLYMDYGRSDKNDSNDEIGGFGLGSKSPYCYTDQFSVISYFGGWRHVYTAFLQADGRPACTRWSSDQTGEPNGLEVMVNVDNNRAYDRFEEALCKLWPYIPTAPRVNKNPFDAPEHEIHFDLKFDKAPLQRAVLHKADPGEPHVRFIQGIVPYSVSLSDLGLPYDHTANQLTDRYTGYDIWIDVGTLEITASRESLSLNDTTKAEARRIIEQVASRIEAEIQSQMHQAKTWYDWVLPASYTGNLSRVAPPSVEPYVVTFTDRDKKKHLLLNASLDQFEHQAAIYQRGRSMKRPVRSWDKPTVRRETLKSLSKGELDKAELYVRPKTSYPIKKFLDQQLHHTEDRIILFTGDYDTIRQWLDTLGIPHQLHEMPYIKPDSSGRSRSRGEATRYETAWNGRTATEIIEGYTDHIVINTPHPITDQSIYNHAADLGIYTGPPVLAVNVPDAHARVQRRIDKHTQGFYNDALIMHPHIDSQRAQQLHNGHHAQAVINRRWMRQMYQIFQGIDTQGTTILHEYRDAIHQLVRTAAPARWLGRSDMDQDNTRDVLDFLRNELRVEFAEQDALVRQVVNASERRLLSCRLRLTHKLPKLTTHLHEPKYAQDRLMNDVMHDFMHLLNEE